MKKFFTIVCAGTVLVGVGVVPGVSSAQYGAGAALSLSPSRTSVQVNDMFSVDLRLNAAQPITSVRTYVTYDPTKLYVASLETHNSDFPYWWDQSFRPETSNMGRVRIQASSPVPGINSDSASIARINFRAIGAGAARLSYDPASLALNSNDVNVLNAGSASEVLIAIGASVQGQAGSSNFYRNLRLTDMGEDVRVLQRFLNTSGFQLVSQGPGSPGGETDYFGPLTQAALIRFQEAYAADVLVPLDLTRGTGFFGARSRAKIQEIVNQ